MTSRAAMSREDRIYVAGHTGLVGSAVVRALQAHGYRQLLVVESGSLDLRRQSRVEELFTRERPGFVFLCAARVGGILANATYGAEFIYDNLAIALNVIEAARQAGVKKLVNLGSSCIYPRLAPQPIPESALLTGALEPTNEPYAVAKIAALKLCRYFDERYGTNFISAMPTNLYGPGDNFDLETSHVLPAMIRKIHEAKRGGGPVVLWGDGSARREFLHVDDLAECLLFLANHCDFQDLGEAVNVGTGTDITIRELASLVAEVVGYRGELQWDTGKPGGTPRKLLDVSRIHRLGWKARIGLREGIERTYRWFLEHPEAAV